MQIGTFHVVDLDTAYLEPEYVEELKQRLPDSILSLISRTIFISLDEKFQQ